MRRVRTEGPRGRPLSGGTPRLIDQTDAPRKVARKSGPDVKRKRFLHLFRICLYETLVGEFEICFIDIDET